MFGYHWRGGDAARSRGKQVGAKCRHASDVWKLRADRASTSAFSLAVRLDATSGLRNIAATERARPVSVGGRSFLCLGVSVISLFVFFVDVLDS